MAQLPMYPGMVNSPITELTNAIDEVQDTIEVSDGLALPDAPNIAVIGTGEDAETIQYGTKIGNVISDVIRGFQGTAKAWSAGQKVARYFTAYDYDTLRKNLITHLDDYEQYAVKKDANGNVTLNGDILLVNCLITTGSNSPEGVVTASKGSLYLRYGGGTSQPALYVKTGDSSGNTGWKAVQLE